MNDTIYRQDAIEVIKGNSFAPGVDYMEINGYGAIEDIRALPSADRPQGWIPCSERLPKENTEVLMSLEWGIDIGECRNGDWHSEWINHYDDDDVLAWMPLPKPWKGVDDE